MQRLADRTVIVTGGAQGMGAAVAERLHAEGASLVLVDREPAVEEVARRVGGVAFVGDAGCAYLLSDDAAYVNGADLRIDGQRTAGI